jgi:DNA-binding MarR family transcriptional regulator
MNYGELLSSFLIDLQRLFRADIYFKDTTYSQILAIISIPSDGIEMSELAWVLGLDNSTVTRLIIRLEKKSWVKRKQSQRDQRAVTVFLTNKGSTIQQDIEKKIDIMGDKIKLEIDEDQREHNLEVLSSFHWTLRKFFLKQ